MVEFCKNTARIYGRKAHIWGAGSYMDIASSVARQGIDPVTMRGLRSTGNIVDPLRAPLGNI